MNPRKNSLASLSKDKLISFSHRRIALFGGLEAFIPRFRGKRYILSYRRNSQTVFRYYLTANLLHELMSTIEDYSKNPDRETHFVLNRFGLHLKSAENDAIVNLVFSEHEFELKVPTKRINETVATYQRIFP